MKETHININAQKASTWMLAIFAFVLLLTAAYTEIFQKRIDNIDYSNIYSNPFSKTFLKTTDKIHLKNRLGDFTLDRENTTWSLSSPRKLKGNNRNISKMLLGLQKLLIKKVYPKDKINMQNFSLNKPLAEISLSSDINKITMSVGLINPINQSAYIMFSNLDKIFQINTIDYSFESVVIGDLIDAAVFSFTTANLELVQIFRGQSKIAFFNIKKVGKFWIDSKGKQLDADNIQQFITSLKALKSNIILDSLTDKSNELLTRAFSRPQYRLALKEFDQKSEVTISNVLYRTADLKIEKKQYFAVKSDNKVHPMLLSKNYLYLFNQKEYKLRQKPKQK
jgi:hypothetical protein